jgi:hypothetical protein
MIETICKKTAFLVPTFPFVKEDKDKDEKPKATGVIASFLKQRAGSKATASTYALKVKGFAKGLLHNGLNSVKEFPNSGGKTKKSHGNKCRSATQEHDTTECFYCTKNKHGQNPIWVKCWSATQKIDTTAFFYCTITSRTQLIPRISVSL